MVYLILKRLKQRRLFSFEETNITQTQPLIFKIKKNLLFYSIIQLSKFRDVRRNQKKAFVETN